MRPPKWLVAILIAVALFLYTYGFSPLFIAVVLVLSVPYVFILNSLARPSRTRRSLIIKAMVGMFLVSVITFLALDLYPYVLLILPRLGATVIFLGFFPAAIFASVLSIILRTVIAEFILLRFFHGRSSLVGLIASLLIFGTPILTTLELIGVGTGLTVYLIGLLGVPIVSRPLGALLFFLLATLILEFPRLAILVILKSNICD